jgi:hypothetical protein
VWQKSTCSNPAIASTRTGIDVEIEDDDEEKEGSKKELLDETHRLAVAAPVA